MLEPDRLQGLELQRMGHGVLPDLDGGPRARELEDRAGHLGHDLGPGDLERALGLREPELRLLRLPRALPEELREVEGERDGGALLGAQEVEALVGRHRGDQPGPPPGRPDVEPGERHLGPGVVELRRVVERQRDRLVEREGGRVDARSVRGAGRREREHQGGGDEGSRTGLSSRLPTGRSPRRQGPAGPPSGPR